MRIDNDDGVELESLVIFEPFQYTEPTPTHGANVTGGVFRCSWIGSSNGKW